MTSALSPAALLRAWELAAPRGALDRPLVLLWAAGQGGSELADLALAERDRALLALRRAMFGDAMACVTDCPACGERLEMAVSATALADALPVCADDEPMRPLTSRDVALAAASDEPERVLIERAGAAGEGFAAALERLQSLQEAAELRFSLTCAACGEAWSEVLDVAAYLWAEVEAAAHRLLGEVAEIAAALGWSEREILALSPIRRRAYLQIARGG